MLKFRELCSCSFREVCCWTEEIPPVPIVTGGMVHRTQAQKGKKKGGGGRSSDYGTLSRRPSFSPSVSQQCAPFRRERSERAESPTKSHENTRTDMAWKNNRKRLLRTPVLHHLRHPAPARGQFPSFGGVPAGRGGQGGVPAGRGGQAGEQILLPTKLRFKYFFCKHYHSQESADNDENYTQKKI